MSLVLLKWNWNALDLLICPKFRQAHSSEVTRTFCFAAVISFNVRTGFCVNGRKERENVHFVSFPDSFSSGYASSCFPHSSSVPTIWSLGQTSQFPGCKHQTRKELLMQVTFQEVEGKDEKGCFLIGCKPLIKLLSDV